VQQPGLTVRYSGDPEPVLYVAGELDVATAPAVRDAFLQLLGRDDVPELALDVSGVAFADSSGLAVLLMGARRWGERGKRLVLRRPSAALRRVIDLAGVARAFEISE
jgi:anti-sigma B factor antagonist